MDRRRAPRPALRRLVLVAAIAAIVGTGVGPAAHPSPARAATASSIETQLLGWVNDARVKRGLVPLKLHPGLVNLAGDHATHMASTNVLAFPSCLTCALDAYGVQRYNYGAVISYTTWPWGDEAAQSIFNGWKASTSHWAKFMSSTFNYIGIGIAYRSSNHSTWDAAVLTESRDRTSPWARMSGGSHSGTTVSWSWTGADTRLQTHTSGLKNFDVQYRVDGGSWSTIRSGTTAKSLSLGSRAHGHYYGLRVRSRDYRGYVSHYTAEIRVWVP